MRACGARQPSPLRTAGADAHPSPRCDTRAADALPYVPVAAPTDNPK
ncbi:hypothetical protein OF001_U190090 [Pseudomonas sp. OF001]|nr:hypothetical protein OF001_U190090 [Pseudomonas sp. OF001]